MKKRMKKRFKLYEGDNIEILKQKIIYYGIKNYTINDNGLVDVDGGVNLFNYRLSKLPIKFGHVSGNFYCQNNQLTSLKGAPQSVGGDFICSYNKLTTLECAPQSVGGNFYCNDNRLTTLEGAPQSVGGYFNCNGNPIYCNLGDIDYKSYIKILYRDKILEEIFWNISM